MSVRRLRLVLPATPPSVNHYKVPIRIAGHISFKLSGAAQNFRALVHHCARGITAIPEADRDRKRVRYWLRAVIYRGHKERGDFDNYWKVLADALAHAGVIHSDAKVEAGFIYMRRDRDRPRTEITVWAILPGKEEKSGEKK